MTQRIVLGDLIILILIAEPDGLSSPGNRITARLSRRRGPSRLTFHGVIAWTLILRSPRLWPDLSAPTCGHRAGCCLRRTHRRRATPTNNISPYRAIGLGLYAAGGTGFFGGLIDYLNLINIRDGGVNGVKLTWSECETEYEVESGIECYERQKSHPVSLPVNPLSVGIAYAMTDRITEDKVPLTTVNHGRTALADGRVFPYVSRCYSPWTAIHPELSTTLLGTRRRDALKGKKIVVLFHGSPYGSEGIPIYELLSKKFGFEVQQIEVPHPGNEQQSQWLTIRRAKPDYVVLRGGA